MKKNVEINSGRMCEPERQQIADYVRGLKDGQYSFELKRLSADRSLNQNATLYMWASIIEQHSGESVESIKKHIMQQNGFGNWVKVRRMGHNLDLVEYNEFMRGSTADLNKHDFIKIMDTLKVLADWHELKLPEPGEKT